MKKKHIYTILIMAICAFNSFCQERDTINISTNDSTIVSRSAAQSNLSELDYYKLLYENSNKNNETYVSLIQWSLGLSFAFLLAIIGSQIFFNYRISKKEIVSIKKDLEERVSELKNSLIENIDNKFTTQNSSFKNDFDKTENQLMEKIETLNRSFSDFKSDLKSDFDKTEKQIIKKIETLERNFSDFKLDIKTDFDKTERQLIDKLDNQFDSKNKLTELQIEVLKTSLSQEIDYIKNGLKENEGHIWELRGISSNALTAFINSAFIQIELKRDVKYILNDIIRTLTKLDEIHQVDYEKLDSLTEKIKQSHIEQFEQIISLYRLKPIYFFKDGVKIFIEKQK